MLYSLCASESSFFSLSPIPKTDFLLSFSLPTISPLLLPAPQPLQCPLSVSSVSPPPPFPLCLFCLSSFSFPFPPLLLLSSLHIPSSIFSSVILCFFSIHTAQLNDTLSFICLFFTTFFSLIYLFFTLSMHE